MERLEQIPAINETLRIAPVAFVRTLEKLIFEGNGDHGNRKCLRAFSCFIFPDKSGDLNVKKAYARQTLTGGDLTAICNLLG